MIESIVRWITIGGATLAVLLQTYFRFLQLGEQRVKIEAGFFPFLRGLLGAFLIACTFYLILSGWATRETTLLGKIFGYMFILLGLILRIWAQITLGRNWSINVRLAQKHSLITTGPYSIVRHPMYSAYGLFALGTFFLTQSIGMENASIYRAVLAHEIQKTLIDTWFLFLLLVAIRACSEELALKDRFGLVFDHYEKDTGMFFPNLRNGVGMHHEKTKNLPDFPS